MCNGFHSRSLLRHSTLVYQGRLHNQPVAVRLHPSARHQSPAVLQHWLDGLSQLSHPRVLPVLGACLEPAAIICPLMQVCCLCMAHRIWCRGPRCCKHDQLHLFVTPTCAVGAVWQSCMTAIWKHAAKCLLHCESFKRCKLAGKWQGS